ncbi:MAG: MSHA biogenesis protein MshM [Gammaproteobacteria bacterium]|jgi:MSHA biogenesis protein MshM
MYEDYFGLDRPPFKITPDTSLFYDGGKRGDILAALVYAVQRGEGIIKVVGEVGSGKTMLCRMLQLKLPKSVEIVYIANPSVSPEDILFVIAHELSLPVGKESSRHEVMHMLQDYLLQRHMESKQVVLFVEEAQGMPLETLEEIRLLSNLETDQNKLLQMILFGQPELDDNLSTQSIRQLRERITHNFELSPLSDDEIHLYLNFRMREVGYTGPELINKAVAKKVEQYSGGLLRRINIIADKILLSAFAEGTHNLSAKHVMAAVNDSAFSQLGPKKSSPLKWIIVLAVMAFVYALFQTRLQWMPQLQAKMAVKSEKLVQIEDPITDITAKSLETKPLAIEVAPKAEPVLAVETEVETLAVAKQATVLPKLDPVVENKAAEVPAVKVVAALGAKPQATIESAPTWPGTAELGLTSDYNQWLNAKLRESHNWLSNADRNGVSIQVMMRNKSAADELVYYLRNNWPLDLSKTYLFEVRADGRNLFRVFYSEFSSMSGGQKELQKLPDSVKSNLPYLKSVYRMQKALL